jgi:hypothetical protein
MQTIGGRARCALGLAVALSLGGCAVFDPYVVKTTTTFQSRASRSGLAPGDFSKPDTEVLTIARDYADRMDMSYRSAARQHAMSKTWLAFIATGAVGGAAYHQVTGHAGHGDDFAPAAVLFGATAVQWADLLISSPRQAAYLLGSQAVQCAKRRTNPYLLIGEDEAALTERFDGAAQQVADLDVALQRKLPTLNEALKAEAKDAIGKADAELVATGKAWEATSAYRARRRAAALGLVTTVDQIGVEVDIDVQRTEVSVAAIRTALSNPAFAPPASEKATPEKKTDGAAAQSGAQLVHAAVVGGSAVRPPELDSLIAATASLRAARERHEAVIARLVDAEATVGPGQCTVAGIAPLSVATPSGPLVPPGQLSISISGPAYPPSIAIDGDSKGLTKELLVGDGAFQARVTATADAAPGERTLVVVTADKAETQKVKFQVGKAAKDGKGDGDAAPAATDTPVAGAPAWVTKQNRFGDVLAYNGGKAAPNSDADWTAALNAYAKEHKLTTGAAANAPTDAVKALMKKSAEIDAAPSHAAAMSPYELWWAEEGRIKDLQKKLGVAQTGVFDAATRTALTAKKANPLTPDLLKTLMK